jgi:crotonobetainyl-CoA:carnitine CoA-transferase CaiB-like acyl-CoA transferase
MADDYHVVLSVGHPVEMKTLETLGAEGWVKGSKHIDQDYRVRDEVDELAGLFESWHRGENEDVWVSETGFPPGTKFHYDEDAGRI